MFAAKSQLPAAGESPEAFARRILPEVSRTFAINIPVLPAPLDLVVTVAYLLCRVADTIEDEGAGSVGRRAELFAELARLTALPHGWRADAEVFTRAARDVIRPEAPASEVQLLEQTPIVLAAVADLPAWTHAPLARCIATMTRGMSEFVRARDGSRTVDGLPDVPALLDYCYYVAGTVGEMLTALFCEYSATARASKVTLEEHARAFGRALQLTNILKDIREDLDRGICWLPRDRMAAHGLSVASLAAPESREQAVALLDELIDLARGETGRAIDYTLAIPATEPGLRLFCLWPLAFAVLTLEKLAHNAAVFDPSPVKIDRETVARVMMQTKQHVACDAELRALFASFA
ncbi:MAG TPA: phytoene/squalene synthase family protein [Kofleriaceae bacterium]